MQAVRRYELMLVLRPDAAEDKASAVIDRTTRYVVASGGQIVKVAPWGRRRLAYPIDRHREGSYHIVVFEAPAEAIAELERSLQITEEVLRYLVTRAIKPLKARRDAAASGDAEDIDATIPSVEDEEEDDDVSGRIDESETEAAPAAID
jgi:small subunit ribosomal protein S6